MSSDGMGTVFSIVTQRAGTRADRGKAELQLLTHLRLTAS